MARIISCTEPLSKLGDKEHKNLMINIENVNTIDAKSTENGFVIEFTIGSKKQLWMYDKNKAESFERDVDLLKTNQFQLLNRG